MIDFPRNTVTAVLATLLTVAIGSPIPLAAADCDAADNFNQVAGEDLCLGIKTFMPGERRAATVLRVFIHGDNSRGGASDYLYRYASPSPPGVVSVAMLRPGHYDRDGRRSSPKTYGRRNWETEESIDAIAAAIRTLAKHHKASRVVLIGHSGGAAIAAVVLGRHPGTAHAALLAACACDKNVKRISRGYRPQPMDVNPMDYVAKIPEGARIVAITGSRDEGNPASLCRPYIERLQERGVRARLDIVEGARHGFRGLGRSTAFRVALAELVETGSGN